MDEAPAEPPIGEFALPATIVPPVLPGRFERLAHPAVAGPEPRREATPEPPSSAAADDVRSRLCVWLT